MNVLVGKCKTFLTLDVVYVQLYKYHYFYNPFFLRNCMFSKIIIGQKYTNNSQKMKGIQILLSVLGRELIHPLNDINFDGFLILGIGTNWVYGGYIVSISIIFSSVRF